MYYFGDENVIGHIIGEAMSSWRLLFEGREQGKGLAPNDGESIKAAKAKRNQLKADNPSLFRSSNDWEVRIY